MEKSCPVYTEPADCQDCYKCIRHCPVKAIRVEGGHAQVVPELCVSCGRCVVNCPAGAKRSRNDIGFVKDLVSASASAGGAVYLSLAPAFAAEFTDFTAAQLAAACMRLGFTGVSETALGGDIVSRHLAALLNSAPEKTAQNLFISSACPAAVEYVKQYAPNFAGAIIDIASPLLAHARFLRAVYGNAIKVVFCGPCIAKKREADAFAEIDAALTFAEIRAWFDSEGITAGQFASPSGGAFVPCRAAAGALFPVNGGMARALHSYGLASKVLSVTIDGIEGIKAALADFVPPGESSAYGGRPVFLELLGCEGGCVGGPGAPPSMRTRESGGIIGRTLRATAYAHNAGGTGAPDLRAVAAAEITLTGTLPRRGYAPPVHRDSEIRGVLRGIGKYGSSDELNCASCGYETCRDFAAALLEKRAEKTMCAAYMRNLAQKKANGLIRAIPSGVVVVDKNLRIVECNRNFARLMGAETLEMFEVIPGLEGADLSKITPSAPLFTAVLGGTKDVSGENPIDIPPVGSGASSLERDIHENGKILHITVFAVEKGEIAAGVLEDITAPQTRRDRTVSRAQKVIDKQVAAVQKIAYLLGENAAETEAILQSIINSYRDGGGNG